MADEDVQEGQTATLTVVDADNAPTVYANHVQVTATPWDLRMQFCQFKGAAQASDGSVSVEYRSVATVYLAPGQARALRRLLNTQLSKYESLWAKQEAIIATVGADEEKASQSEQEG